jgi:hypothetical protein
MNEPKVRHPLKPDLTFTAALKNPAQESRWLRTWEEFELEAQQ